MDETTARLLRALHEDLGPIVNQHLADCRCEDIALNEDGKLWTKRISEPWKHIGEMSPIEAMGVISSLARLKSIVVDRDAPILETVLPSGNRIEAVLPPVVRAPIFSIRLRAQRVHTLADYVAQGILRPEHKRSIETAIRCGETILVSGAPGSGKTTLLNACLHELAHLSAHLRVGIVEDAPELQYTGENFVSLLAPLGENKMLQCLQVALRLRFDRLVVGEVRDGAALTMLKAFNTGHPGGLCTLHANDAEAALLRLEGLVQEAAPAYNARPLIAEAIQLVVHIDGATGAAGRKVREVFRLNPHEKGGYLLCDEAA